MSLIKSLLDVYLVLHANPALPEKHFRQKYRKDNTHTYIITGEHFVTGIYSLYEEAFNSTIKHSLDMYTDTRVMAYLLLSSLIDNKEYWKPTNLNSRCISVTDWELRSSQSNEILDQSYPGTFVGSSDMYFRGDRGAINIFNTNTIFYKQPFTHVNSKIHYKINTSEYCNSLAIPCKYISNDPVNLAQFLILCEGFFMPIKIDSGYLQADKNPNRILTSITNNAINAFLNDDDNEVITGNIINVALRNPDRLKTTISVSNSNLFLLGHFVSDDDDNL